MNEVLQKAITTLEVESCEDCISRSEAIRVLKEDVVDIDGTNIFENHGLYPWNVIAGLPSVYPQPKIGKWKKLNDNGLYKCSKCDCFILLSSTHSIEIYKYCHYCGAKMEVDENDEGAGDRVIAK